MSGDWACPCGEVHELSAKVRSAFEAVTAGLDETITTTTPEGSWRVPRIFIAVHGLKAAELPELARRYGFARAG